MKKFILLPILPLVAACASGGSSDTPPPTGGVTPPPESTATFAVTTADTDETKGLIVKNAGEVRNPDSIRRGTTLEASVITDEMVGLYNRLNVIGDRETYRDEEEHGVVRTQNASADYMTRRNRVSRGDPAVYAETIRLYDPNNDLIGIEARTTDVTSAAVVGSVGYWGQWNGEVDQQNFEGGAVNVVVNGSTGEADLRVFYPDRPARLIDEQVGANTLTYNAATQQVRGAVTFNTTGEAAAAATGQTVVQLAGPSIVGSNGVAAPQLLSGVAFTDDDQPFEANIGIVAGVDINGRPAETR